MGGAGGEGPLAALPRTDAQDGGGDEHIGDRNKDEGDGQHEDAHNVEDGLAYVDISTGQPQDRRHVTEEVVDFPEVPAEGQGED